MYLRLCLLSNSDGHCYQLFHSKSFGQISSVPQSLHVNLGFVGLSKINTSIFENLLFDHLSIILS